jgi:hypothetical protein
MLASRAREKSLSGFEEPEAIDLEGVARRFERFERARSADGRLLLTAEIDSLAGHIKNDKVSDMRARIEGGGTDRDEVGRRVSVEGGRFGTYGRVMRE